MAQLVAQNQKFLKPEKRGNNCSWRLWKSSRNQPGSSHNRLHLVPLHVSPTSSLRCPCKSKASKFSILETSLWVTVRRIRWLEQCQLMGFILRQVKVKPQETKAAQDEVQKMSSKRRTKGQNQNTKDANRGTPQHAARIWHPRANVVT